MRRLIPAQILFVLFSSLLSPGCFLSHETPVHSHPHVPPDAGALYPDLGPAIDAGIAPMCRLSSDAITVSVEAVGRPMYCTRTHVDDISVTGIDAEPSMNGIRIHADYCPAADDDCRCDILVSGIGTDVAPLLLPTGSLALDLSLGESSAAQFVSLRDTTHPLCDCPTCPCALDVWLYAADAEPALAPSTPRGLAFSVGPFLCRTGRCPMDVSQLHAYVIGRETDLVAGSDQTIASVRLRGVRDAQTTCDPCPSCGGSAFMGPPRAAWAAWREHELWLPD